MSDITPSTFEESYELAPLGDDLLARVERAEALLGIVLGTVVFGNEARLKTEQRTKLIADKVIEVLDEFRDPSHVAERKEFEYQEDLISGW